MSRFNTLYHGSAAEAAAHLDGGDIMRPASPEDLQVALINALRRIDALEKRLVRVDGNLNTAAEDHGELRVRVQNLEARP